MAEEDKPVFDELLASLKLKSAKKRGVKCIPLPIGSFLKLDAQSMKFGRKETIKSFDTEETDNNEPDSFRRKGKITKRHKNGVAPADTIELDGDPILITNRSSKDVSDVLRVKLPK